MYLDTIRERLRCHEVKGGEGGGAGQNSKNGWITNIGGGGLLINGEIDPSINYIYMSACVYGCIKIWVSCKMQSVFQ